MIEGDRGIVLRQVGALFRAGTFAGMSDGQLLERFLARGGEAGELAFSVLVERHGPMVLRVCRGVLGDRHDAEDAFQATFLALVRGAGTIRRRDSVACWLHGAALRVAACARTAGARRKKHEGRFAASRGDSARERGVDDLGPVLHEEVGRLPARYRAAVLLCDLEGLSLDEAARHLGCPIGTVKSRVARGRARLRDRLARRGIVPTSASAVGVALAREARAAVRPALAETTARLAARFAAGRGTAGMLVSPAEWLARLDHRRLFMARLRSMTLGMATVGVLTAGATLLGQQQGAVPSPAPPGGEAKEARDATITKVYAVADLLAGSLNSGEERPTYDMVPLMELLSSSVAPGTWRVLDERGRAIQDKGGPGSIIPFNLDLSLIVRHTPDVHVQFAGRLEQLRRVLGAYQTNTAMNAAPPTSAAAGQMQQMMQMMGGTRSSNMDQGGRAPGMMMGPGGSSGRAQGGTMGSTSGAARKGIDVRSRSRISTGTQPGAAQPGMPGDAAQGNPGANQPMGQQGGGSAQQGAPGQPAENSAAGAAPGGVPMGVQPVRSGPYPSARTGHAAGYDPGTEQRLRALEEKLDRVLKALDATRPDDPRGAARP